VLASAGYRVLVPGRNHLGVVADPFFKGAELGFLGSHR
jgi:hypothetical protein